MTRGPWILLAVVGLVIPIVGGSLVGGGREIIGVVLIVVGAPTMGIAIGRYRSSRPPLT